MTELDYRPALARQLSFIENSCFLYDNGRLDDAIRIGTALRVLFYDTSHSTSVVTHLGVKDRIRLLSTSSDPTERGPNEPPGMTPQFFFGLGMIAPGPSGARHVPRLSDGPVQRFVSVRDWWNEVVWILDRETHITRWDIVRAAVNKDGGAHVDPSVSRGYARLALGPFDTSFRVGDPTGRGPAGTHLVSLRQLGYEVLNSPDLTSIAGVQAPEPGGS